MSFKSRVLLFIQKDNTIYQLLLVGLLISSPALHYLCFHNTFDPIQLRLLNSALCLIALGLSVFPAKYFDVAGQYLAALSFIVINNGILLGKNGFDQVYLFSSITIFIALTLFCKKRWEFVALCSINLLANIIAYISAPKLYISLGTLVILELIFTAIAYVSFLVMLAYNLKFKRAVSYIVDLNESLIRNDEMLRQSGKQLDAMINSLNDIIFEFDANKVCVNAWFRKIEGRAVDPATLVGKPLAQVLGAEKAKKFDDAMDFIFEHRKPFSVTYPSDYGTGAWLVARLSPIFDSQGNFTRRISASVTDISEQKKYADALKENEALLLEAQHIAKMGNWYFDVATREAHLSESVYKICEIDNLPENIEKFDYYLSLIHPDDRAAAYEYFTHIRQISDREFEHRLITPNGNLKYLKVLKGELITDQEGKVKRITGILQDITATKLSEKRLKISQTELLEAQVIAKIGNWKWDTNLKRLTGSEEINNIFEIDYALEEGKDFIKLMMKYAHPEDRHILKQHIKDIFTTHTSYEYRIITPKGNVKHVSIIVGKLLKRENGSVRKIIGTVQDITDRKQAEIEYQRTENKYKLVLETIKLPAVSVDKNCNVIFCNKYTADMLGYEPGEIIGLNWLDRFIPEIQRKDIYDWFLNGTVESQFTNSIICRNGEERIISWQNTVSYDENGKIKEVTGIGEDITDRELETRALISAKEQAEKSSHFKSEFLSIMSHEIRTPMNAVIGTTNLLLSEDPKPDQLDYLNILKFSGENLLAIINDILDYNKIEAGKLQLNTLPFNICTLAQKIKQSFNARAVEKSLEIELNIDQSIPEYLMGDQVRLGQVLNNLLSNAIKFTHEGKVSLQLQKEFIDGKNVTIGFTVTDTGIGIAPENLAMIFDPFMQESQKHDNDYGGTGLGLAITRRLVELHKSNIEVKSEANKGTQFSFDITFSIANQLRNGQSVSSATTAIGTERSLKGMKVLVVDDNKMNLMIASKFLKKWNAESDESLSGETAIEMVKANHYDLIIMDLQMPGLDGFETTRAIREFNAITPIIALTADAMPETHNKALAAGMVSYLTKPFVPDALYEKISSHYVPAVEEK